MTNVIIRKAREDELKVIQNLNQQLFEHDYPYDDTLDINWVFSEEGEEYFKDKISEKEGVCFVAEVDGQVAGYLAGAMAKPYHYRTIKKMSELENTLVREEYRGQRIGEKLFNEFLKWSKDHGAEVVTVSASADNEGAIRFYQRVGFLPYALELEYKIK